VNSTEEQFFSRNSLRATAIRDGATAAGVVIGPNNGKVKSEFNTYVVRSTSNAYSFSFFGVSTGRVESSFDAADASDGIDLNAGQPMDAIKIVSVARPGELTISDKLRFSGVYATNIIEGTAANSDSNILATTEWVTSLFGGTNNLDEVLQAGNTGSLAIVLASTAELANDLRSLYVGDTISSTVGTFSRNLAVGENLSIDGSKQWMIGANIDANAATDFFAVNVEDASALNVSANKSITLKAGAGGILLDGPVIPTHNGTNVALISDVTGMPRKVSFIVQDPTNGIPYWQEFDEQVELQEFRVQSWACTGEVDLIVKDWNDSFYTYATWSSDNAVSTNGLQGSFAAGTVLTNDYEIGVIFNGLDNFAITNQIKITVEGVTQ
jgi:hypothetical protein